MIAPNFGTRLFWFSMRNHPKIVACCCLYLWFLIGDLKLVTSRDQSPNQTPNKPLWFLDFLSPDLLTNHSRNPPQPFNQCLTSNGYRGQCIPMVMCYFQYGSLKHMLREKCQVRVNHSGSVVERDGVCCPHDTSFTPVSDDVPYRLTIPEWPRIKLQIEPDVLDRAIPAAEEWVIDFFKNEESFVGKFGQVQIFPSPAFFHQATFGPPNENQLLLNLLGFRQLQISRMLIKLLNLTAEQVRDGLSRVSLLGTKHEQSLCLKRPSCNFWSKYRTMDGSCNNLRYPLRGRSMTQLTRLLPPNYSDGLSEFRVSVVGHHPLPWPRIVSSRLFSFSTNRTEMLDNRLSVVFMQFGQLLDHEILLSSSTRALNGKGLLCCNKTNPEKEVRYPICRPIHIPLDDPFYHEFDDRCINFVRNAVGPKSDCTLGFREQTNLVTPFIDVSAIYGSNRNRTHFLRSFKDGLLASSIINGREWLPLDLMNHSSGCFIIDDFNSDEDSPRSCVFSGDVRVNQQPGITLLSLIFLREHNRIARQLKQLNPDWKDEVLFEETRRIVAAQMQHITYNEFLPEALGRPVMKRYNLTLEPNGYSTGYDPDIDPSILDEFSVAAFRWHTLIQKFYHFFSSQGRRTNLMELNKVFNNPSVLYPSGRVDDLIRGLMMKKSEKFDSHFVEDVYGKMFLSSDKKFGTDLVSINVQRGRDHGIPTYNQIRKLCGLDPARSFRELGSLFFDPDVWKKFEEVYDHVDDIDFWVAGNHEKPLSEGIVGPTFSCVVGEQFRRIKLGDRFWYENGNMLHSFTLAQLREIRKASFSGLFCLNGDHIARMPRFAFLPISKQNPVVDCLKIPKINLSRWKNEGNIFWR